MTGQAALQYRSPVNRKGFKLPDLLKTTPRGGHIDGIDEKIISGWAVDRTQSGRPATLLLLIDEQIAGSFTCSEPRPDLNASSIPGDRLGFRFELPAAALDGCAHTLRIRFRSGEELTHGVDHDTGDLRVQYCPTSVVGMVDGMFGASVRGWAFRLNKETGERTGGLTLDVKASGVQLGSIKANLIRNDVAEVHGCEPHCGFLYKVPLRHRDGRPFVVEFHATPEGSQIGGSPFHGSVLVRDSMDQLYDMYSQVELLCSQAFALKSQLRTMVIADEFTMESYHDWATIYFDTLRARLIAERRSPAYQELMGDAVAKISVICPVYKPKLADFAAAIESVRRQSWTVWELIIVDDGSASPALTEVIADLCKSDKRIRAVPHRKNQGISAATNTAIAAATGDWVALFDHDDLLVDVGLEIMLLAARNTGARMLYSDEDKIDEFGNYSEPHLKTDWNYRLLLANNYICHLLFVEMAVLRAAGPLQKRYDGAQDHDLILRLSEQVPPADIHHVPEILYHWRKSAGSTASMQSAKPYAVDAGKQAVTDHLARRGLPATISARFLSTVYEVNWGFTAEPTVSILIPFKDQVEITQRCVECIFQNTTYQNYEIVLIDNWSTDAETQAWLTTISDNPNVKVIRIEESFNYSRLNNRAAEQLDSDYLLFMNNDVFVSQPGWLRGMVDEGLADPRVGVVGIKLVYPNQTVQHAGVVLGVGGVADHSFRYAEQDVAGYCFRAVCAQDMSAVTAACMLCRADAFRDVGMFDEANLTVAFNDVDLCLRIGQAGYRVVMTPSVVAEHHESLSRGSDLLEHNLPRFYGENQWMMDRWAALIRSDPYYNPHFSHETGMFEKLSSASLKVDRAQSLLRKPVRQAALPGTRDAEPSRAEPAVAKRAPAPAPAKPVRAKAAAPAPRKPTRAARQKA